MRQGDADAADEQDFEALGEIGNDVADGKEREEDEQQLSAFDIFRCQHQRQRQQRDDPRIHGNHNADFGRRHIEGRADVAQ